MNFKKINSSMVLFDKKYNYQTQLKTFREKYGNNFVFFNKEITDENFSKSAIVPMGTETWEVDIILIKREVTVQECVTYFLREENARFTSPQGLSFIYQNYRKILPAEGKIFAIHSKEYLLSEGGDYLIPYININKKFLIFFELRNANLS